MLKKIEINYSANLLLDVDKELNIDCINDLIQSKFDDIISGDMNFPPEVNDVSIDNTHCYTQEFIL